MLADAITANSWASVSNTPGVAGAETGLKSTAEKLQHKESSKHTQVCMLRIKGLCWQ